ncbi:MAG: hypothetical protein VX871_09320 [Pseudomonadota bacterium]|nr:hypothetical protein [Pseudomonadota bacterium]
MLGALALTLMGAEFFRDQRKSSKEKRKLSYALAAVGVITSMAAWGKQYESDKRLETWITGGDSYPYMEASIANNSKDRFPIWIRSSGTMRDVYYAIYQIKPEGRVFKGSAPQRIGVLLKEGYLTPYCLTEGLFEIQFNAPNGGFVQELKIQKYTQWSTIRTLEGRILHPHDQINKDYEFP